MQICEADVRTITWYFSRDRNLLLNSKSTCDQLTFLIFLAYAQRREKEDRDAEAVSPPLRQQEDWDAEAVSPPQRLNADSLSQERDDEPADADRVQNESVCLINILQQL